MKIKKNINKLTIGFIVLFSLTIIILILSFNFNINSLVGIVKHNQPFYIEDLKISYDNVTWFDVDQYDAIPYYEKDRTAYIRGHLPDNTALNKLVKPTLYFEARNNFSKIYIDGMLKGDFSFDSAPNIGTTWNLITLEKDFVGKEIYINMVSSDIRSAGRINDIFIDRSAYIFKNILTRGIITSLISVVMIIVGITLIVVSVNRFYRTNKFYFIGILSLCYGIFLLTTLNYFSQIISFNFQVWALLSHLSLFIMPICFLNIIAMFIENRYYQTILKKATMAYWIFLTVITALNTVKLVPINLWNGYLLVLTFTLEGFYCYLLCKDFYFTYKNNTKRLNPTFEESILPGSLILMFASNIDSITLMKGNYSYSDTYLSPSIMLIFLAISIFVSVNFVETANEEKLRTSEEVIINEEIIKSMINEQKKLFAEREYEGILKKYMNSSVSFLFPSFSDKILKERELSEITYKNMLYRYLDFRNNNSSFIYLQVPVKENNNNIKYKILEATGRFAKYKDLNPYETTNFKEFNAIAKKANYSKTIFENEIIVPIGSEDNTIGIIYYDSISSLTDIQQSLLESFMHSTSVLLRNKNILHNTKVVRNKIIYTLNELADSKSIERGLHISRVSMYCQLIGDKLNLPKDDIEILALASSLHDIGKIKLPDYILGKVDKLSPEEKDIMDTHTDIGYSLLADCRTPILKAATFITKEHHERYDGTGRYGFTGETMNLFSKIVAVADVFDALLSEKKYKKAWTISEAFDYFNRERGKQFDPELVNILFENFEDFKAINSSYSDF
ncbi:MAG: HD-GYP domain-containing protein [Lachnospirales bacterium]